MKADDAPGEDHEPDVQLSLANERTFLAWERVLVIVEGSGS